MSKEEDTEVEEVVAVVVEPDANVTVMNHPCHILLAYIPIRLVRYPTKIELEWYNKQDLV